MKTSKTNFENPNPTLNSKVDPKGKKMKENNTK